MHLKMVTMIIITMLIMMITTVVVWMMLMLMKRPVTHLPYIIPVMESMLFLAPPLFLPSPIHDDIHHHHSFYYQHPTPVPDTVSLRLLCLRHSGCSTLSTADMVLTHAMLLTRIMLTPDNYYPTTNQSIHRKSE